MGPKTRISLIEPGAKRAGVYFSLRLKRNCHNEPSEHETPGRILVLANISGKFRYFRRLLLMNGVIDKSYRWTYGNGHLVLLGNFFEESELGIACLWLIYSLEEKAARSGGYVHFILSNREIANLNGEWRYAHPRYAVKRKSSKHPSTALYDGNNELWRWLRHKNIIEKIGDMCFLHSTMFKEVYEPHLSITEINNMARSYYARPEDLFVAQKREIKTYPVADHFDVNAIITGNPSLDLNTDAFKGKLVNMGVDPLYGKPEALLIKEGRFYKIDARGDRTRIR